MDKYDVSDGAYNLSKLVGDDLATVLDEKFEVTQFATDRPKGAEQHYHLYTDREAGMGIDVAVKVHDPINSFMQDNRSR